MSEPLSINLNKTMVMQRDNTNVVLRPSTKKSSDARNDAPAKGSNSGAEFLEAALSVLLFPLMLSGCSPPNEKNTDSDAAKKVKTVENQNKKSPTMPPEGKIERNTGNPSTSTNNTFYLTVTKDQIILQKDFVDTDYSWNKTGETKGFTARHNKGAGVYYGKKAKENMIILLKKMETKCQEDHYYRHADLNKANQIKAVREFLEKQN